MARLTSLPPSLLAQVLSFLDLPSRCRALLACRHLARAGADPLLWQEVALPRPLPSHGLIELLDIPRFSLLRSLHLQDLKLDLHHSLAVKLLRYIDSNTNLSSIDLSSSNLSTVPAFPLAESLSRVGTVRLSATKLTWNRPPLFFANLQLSSQDALIPSTSPSTTSVSWKPVSWWPPSNTCPAWTCRTRTSETRALWR